MMDDEFSGIDPSDRQQHRHAARLTADGLAIFRKEMLAAELPEALADQLVVEHYRWLLQPDVAGAMSALIGRIDMLRGEEEDDEP